MAYNYLALVNEVQRRLNEIELTSATFITARGAHAQSKDAVNASIRHINQEEFEWPWNHVEQHEVMSKGITRYSFPYDAKTVNMNSFRIKRDETLGNPTVKLKVLNYEEYLDKYSDSEYNSSEQNQTLPRHVARAPSREFLLVPTPDKDYEFVYEYYTASYDLQNADDVPTIPEPYRHVIVDGAMYYAYMFRGNEQAANMSQAKFSDGIKYMRSLNINRTEYIRDTRVKY